MWLCSFKKSLFDVSFLKIINLLDSNCRVDCGEAQNHEFYSSKGIGGWQALTSNWGTNDSLWILGKEWPIFFKSMAPRKLTTLQWKLHTQEYLDSTN